MSERSKIKLVDPPDSVQLAEVNGALVINVLPDEKIVQQQRRVFRLLGIASVMFAAMSAIFAQNLLVLIIGPLAISLPLMAFEQSIKGPMRFVEIHNGRLQFFTDTPNHTPVVTWLDKLEDLYYSLEGDQHSIVVEVTDYTHYLQGNFTEDEARYMAQVLQRELFSPPITELRLSDLASPDAESSFAGDKSQAKTFSE